MNLQHIVNEIEKVDPEVYERLDTRRSTMRRFAFVGKVLATAAIPSALGTMFKKAYAQSSTTDIVGVLNYALTLEYLEAEFYTTAVSKGTALIPAGAATGAFTTIRDHENAHVKFLQDTIKALGGTPVSKPTFDFSGGMGSGNGPFKDAFTNYDLLLAVAQVFEDTGVRAYKGQAANVMSNNDVLTAALQIHSVEARHASHIRYMRRAKGTLIPSGVTVKPWITLAQSGIESGSSSVNALIQKSYAGEDLTTQAGVTITNINGQSISAAAASESFDEPLTKEQVLDIVAPFIKP